MKINVFEGFRRVSWLLQIVVVVVTVAIQSMNEPYIPIKLATRGPGLPFYKISNGCSATSRDLYVGSKRTQFDVSVSLNLCFESRKSNDGTELVPYKVDESDRSKVWMNIPYSNEVETYANARAAEFEMPKAYEAEIKKEYRSAKWRHAKDGLLYVSIGWGVIWVFTTVAGWIARGFLGIPAGKDFRGD